MKKLFTNDKFFLAMVILTVLGKAVNALYFLCPMSTSIPYAVNFAFFAACEITLYSSYTRHSKNVMKGMMGAMLTAQVLCATTLLSEAIDASINLVIPVVIFVVSVLLFTNHFVINSDRKASAKRVKFNQILLVLLAIGLIAYDIYSIAMKGSAISGALVALILLDVVGSIGMTASVVCVESRLDAYRLDRENAGWTEEKGYPENYVHEYEKK